MPELKFAFNTGRKEAAAVEIEFADGRHVIPAWLVAHLGGTEAVTSPESLERARTVTLEEFNQRFHQAVSGAALRQVQKNIISDHLRNLPYRSTDK